MPLPLFIKALELFMFMFLEDVRRMEYDIK